MNARNRIYGLVLAGGQSSRMGEDKSRLKWNGHPLYQHMAGLLDQAGISHVMVSSNHLPGKDMIADEISGRGPLSGIDAALKKIPDDSALLVVPVDMPLLPVAALRLLSEQTESCSFQDYSLPLLLVVSPELRQQVDQRIRSKNQRDYALWRLHKALQGKTMALPGLMADYFGNANTPEDWQRCQILAAHNRSGTDKQELK